MILLLVKSEFFLSILKHTEIDTNRDTIMIDDEGLLYVEENEYPIATIKNTELMMLKYAVRMQKAWHVTWKILSTEEERTAQLYLNGDGRQIIFHYLTNVVSTRSGRNKAFGTRDFAEFLCIKRSVANIILKWLRDMGYITYQRSWKEVTREGAVEMVRELDKINAKFASKYQESDEESEVQYINGNDEDDGGVPNVLKDRISKHRKRD